MERQFEQAVTPEVARWASVRADRARADRAVGARLQRPGQRGGLGELARAARGSWPTGRAAGQVEAATGGAVSLTAINGSFVLPAGRLLSGTGTAELRTQSDTTITVTITGNELRLSMSPPLYIDAQWPAQNMVLSSVVHQIDTEVTTVDVRTVDDEWGDGMLDFTGTARGTIADTVASIIAHTPLHRSRMRGTDDGLAPRARGAPAAGLQPVAGRGPDGDDRRPHPGLQLAPSRRDERRQRARRQQHHGGGDAHRQRRVRAARERHRRADRRRHVAERERRQRRLDRPAARGGAGRAGDRAAVDIQSISVSSAGIEVIKDGARVATLDRITIHRGGSVSLDRITLHGEAERLAEGESGLWALLAGIPVAIATGRTEGLTAGAELAHQRGADRPVIVPGLTRVMIEAQLQRAFTQLLAEHGRTAIPGVDLGSVLGVPSGPAAPARGR